MRKILALLIGNRLLKRAIFFAGGLFFFQISIGSYEYIAGNAAYPGCMQLDVVIHNQTKYVFKPDDSYVDNSKKYVASSSTGFGDIAANGDTTLRFLGLDDLHNNGNNRDEVDASMRYNATLNGQVLAQQVTIVAKKASCNLYAGKAKIYINSFSNYGCDKAICTNNNGNTLWSFSSYPGYGYPDQAADSSVTSNGQLIFTAGATYSSSNLSNEVTQGPDVAKTFSTYSRVFCYPNGNDNEGFHGLNPGAKSCDMLCQNVMISNKGDIICSPSSNDTYNKHAKLEFYIYSMPVEKLTIQFFPDSANVQTTTAQAMLHAIYNHLNPEYLAALGINVVSPPAQIDAGNKSITFSMACNSLACKRPNVS